MNEYKSMLYKSLSFLFVVIALLFVYCVFWGPGRDWGTSFAPARTITVSASDFKYVSPDVATISFSAISEGEDIQKITNENNEKINSAIRYLKEKGVDEKDIKTLGYNLVPVYSENNRNNNYDGVFVPEIVKYRITQSIEVKVRDFQLLSGIVGTLPSIGINRIDNIGFDVEDEDKFIEEIQKSAFEKARDKAEKMAAYNNVKLGRIVNIHANNISPYGSYFRTMKADEVSTQSMPSIESGSQKLTVSVSVVYEIK